MAHLPAHTRTRPWRPRPGPVAAAAARRPPPLGPASGRPRALHRHRRPQAWKISRTEFGTFMRADVTSVAGSAGPPCTGRSGAAPVAPRLVFTDGLGRQLALNGTP